MTNIDKTKPVMITGATGYVAGWIVKKLLTEGLTVHAQPFIAIMQTLKKHPMVFLQKKCGIPAHRLIINPIPIQKR